MKWKRIGNEIWLEWANPRDLNYGSDIGEVNKLKRDLAAYNNRPHYSIHPDHLSFDWWGEGEVKELDKDFEVGKVYFANDGVVVYNLKYAASWVKMAIPIYRLAAQPQPMKEERKPDAIDKMIEEQKKWRPEERKFTNRCLYELAVEEYFGLHPEVQADIKIVATYEQLVGLVCFVVEAKKLKAEREIIEALKGLVADVKSKPNDTRYATHIKIAEDVLSKHKL